MEMTMGMLIGKFVIAAAMIIAAGTGLAILGNRLSEQTRLSGVWVGIIILALVTSLPELVTACGAVTIVKSPDLALGILLGSVLFNLLLIAVLDAFQGKGAILGLVGRQHVLSGSAGIILVALCAAGIVVHLKQVGGMDLVSILIAVTYLFLLRIVLTHESRNPAGKEDGKPADAERRMRGTTLAGGLVLCAAVVVAAGLWLDHLAVELAATTVLGSGFIGTFLIAATSSLPELSVGIAAVRVGAYDMAVANIFGSNMFNLAIIPVVDALYRRGGLISDASSSHLLTAVIGILLTGIALFGVTCRSRRTIMRLGFSSVAIVLLYFAGSYLLFRAGISH